MLAMSKFGQPAEEVLDKVVGTMDEPVDQVVDKLGSWTNTLTGMIPNFVIAILVMVIFWGLSILFAWSTRRVFARISGNLPLSRLIGTFVRWVTLSAGLLVALGLLELDKTLTSLLAGAGVVGLALGFAFQNIAANLLSGVMLSVRKPYREGDVIRSNGFYGIVDDINLRTTNVLTPDGRLVLIPNKDMFENPIENFTWTGAKRVEVAVGVSYGEDLEAVQGIARKAVEKLELRDPAKEVEVLFSEFGASSINFLLLFWIPFSSPLDELHARSQAVVAIKKAFDQADITIPFPIRTLDFGIKGGATLAEMPLRLAEKADSRAPEVPEGGEGEKGSDS
jgi:small conductance mechanosensitive channel